MVANNNEFGNLGFNEEKKNFPYSSEVLNDKFNEKKLAEFKKEMDQIRGEVHPAFLEALNNYEGKVYSLLKNNLSVAASSVVQEEIATQNARIATKFVGDGIILEKAYNDIFS